MGFFSWLGGLLDQLIEWLGRVVAAFLESLIWALQTLWDAVIEIALIVAFGYATTLHVIFYAGYALGETIMEIWDPSYYNSKPSQVFTIKQAPQNTPLPTNRSEAKVLTLDTPLPTNRSEAKVLTLENWY